ncbi:addiction module antidote protein [Sphingobium sp. YR768]|uniref:addiction module antidote protein n=1 Tax=Sphingobium sp. YR768 TaxID=1884365 RepID=UPI0008C081A0|nr:addiction module antidote protein [Sphingobium sp. YR768]SES19739.1 probable addiction module antidote protein [Sphingobium sp. YR768]
MKTKEFDASKFFTDADDQIELLEDALSTGEAGYIAAAIGTIAKAKGMSKVASDAGLNRQALYAALKDDGNPTLETLLKVLRAVGIELHATKIPEPA